jgi:hypothetical protein
MSDGAFESRNENEEIAKKKLNEFLKECCK